MVSRVFRDLGAESSEIMVLNDEAHHCYLAALSRHREAGQGADRG